MTHLYRFLILLIFSSAVLAQTSDNSSNDELFVGSESYGFIDPATVLRIPADYPTIQAAIDATVDGDTVLVAPGTYAGDGNRDIRFHGKNIVLLSAYGPEVTVIDCNGTRLDPHRGFSITGGENSSLIIEGFTVTGGYAPKDTIVSRWGRVVSGRYGGGVFIENSSPTIRNCIVERNYADQEGGGVFVWSLATSNAAVTLDECQIIGNVAWHGGGLGGWNGDVTLDKCNVISNIAYSFETTDEDGSGSYHVAGEGGAIFHSWDNLIINNSIFAFNHAEAGASVEDCNSGSICGDAAISCSDLYGNTYGEQVTNYFDLIMDQANINDNFSSDPLFCDTANGDFHISESSPCAPDNSGCASLVGALGVNCSAHKGPVWHVATDGSDETGDGSQTAPFATIQTAIDVAASGDTVLVAPGTYTGPGNWDLSLQDKNIVLSSKEGPEATIIDCDNGYNARRAFYFRIGVGPTTVVNGFTVVNGSRPPNHGTSDGSGGAVLLEGASPTFIDCHFKENGANYGGAIACWSDAAPTFERCLFIDNTATISLECYGSEWEWICEEFAGYGGAVYLSNSSAQFKSCTFVGNEAHHSPEYGRFGVGHVVSGGEVSLENCIVSFNGHVQQTPELVTSIQASSASVVCSDFHGNTGGDWVGSVEGQGDANGNFSANPLFCDRSIGDFHITDLSPCVAENNECASLIGALGVDCSGYVGPVWHVSTFGSDETGDGSQSAPFATIQFGIDAAVAGDTVLVAPGTYTGPGNWDFKIRGKNLIVQSSDGPVSTIVDFDGPGYPSRGLDMDSTLMPLTTIQGFSFIDGTRSPGGAVLIENASPLFRQCYFIQNRASRGGAIAAFDGAEPLFEECLFEKNTALSQTGPYDDFPGFGGAVYLDGATARFRSCTFVHNEAEDVDEDGKASKGNVLCGGTAEFTNCIVAFNGPQEPFWGLGLTIEGSNALVHCSDFYGNDKGDWVGSVEGQDEHISNFSADPMFCDTASGVFNISESSPCAPQNNVCGELIGALGVVCKSPVGQLVYIDIKPGSCPNPINANGSALQSNAVLPVAVLGTEEFDVNQIDPASVTLAGVSPIRHSIEDVSTPIDRSEDSCACTENGPDGFDDLTLNFRRTELIDALSGLPRSAKTRVYLTGVLHDSTAIESYDCVKLLHQQDGPQLTSDTLGVPDQFKLYGAYPNPFNPSTTINFDLPEQNHVQIDVFNMLGQRVALLADEMRPAGRHSVLWNADGLASGIYIYRVQTDSETITKKMILLK